MKKKHSKRKRPSKQASQKEKLERFFSPDSSRDEKSTSFIKGESYRLPNRSQL